MWGEYSESIDCPNIPHILVSIEWTKERGHRCPYSTNNKRIPDKYRGNILSQSWDFKFIHNHPAIRRRLQFRLKQIILSKLLCQRTPFLNQRVAEMLRIVPHVQFMQRHLWPQRRDIKSVPRALNRGEKDRGGRRCVQRFRKKGLCVFLKVDVCGTGGEECVEGRERVYLL